MRNAGEQLEPDIGGETQGGATCHWESASTIDRLLRNRTCAIM